MSIEIVARYLNKFNGKGKHGLHTRYNLKRSCKHRQRHFQSAKNTQGTQYYYHNFVFRNYIYKLSAIFRLILNRD